MKEEELNAFKDEMRERRLLADFNVRYHDVLCRRYINLDLALRMVLAVSAVVVFVGAGVWNDIPIVWQTLAGAIALVSTSLLPLLKWNKLIPRIEAERLRGIQLKNEYENLWIEFKSGADWAGILKELRKLRKKDNDAEQSGGIVPEHKDLLIRSRSDVIKARGGTISGLCL